MDLKDITWDQLMIRWGEFHDEIDRHRPKDGEGPSFFYAKAIQDQCEVDAEIARRDEDEMIRSFHSGW